VNPRDSVKNLGKDFTFLGKSATGALIISPEKRAGTVSDCRGTFNPSRHGAKLAAAYEFSALIACWQETH